MAHADSNASPPRRDDAPSAPDRPRLTRLAQGLRVVTSLRPGRLTALHLFVSAGAVDEQPEEAGLAHFLEHMLFKGTPSRGLGASAAEIEALGGDLNAYTAHDHTVLHATVLDDWRGGLDVLADMALRPLLDPDELAREKEVVIEEIRAYDDDPDDALAEAVEAAQWAGHPYGRRILGDVDRVRALSPAALQAFLARAWTPDRVVLAVVGPAPHDDVVAAAEALLGPAAPTPPWRGWGSAGSPRALPPPPARPGPTVLAVPGRFDSTAVLLSWPLPGAGHPDLPALDVLVTALASGASGQLNKALDDAEDAGFGAWADLSPAPAASSLRVGLIPDEGGAARSVEVVLDTVRRLAGAIDGNAVARARQLLRASFLHDVEDPDAVAGELAAAVAWHDDPHAPEAERRALQAVTPEDVSDVAARWLRPERAVIGLVGDVGAGALTAVRRALSAASRPARAASPRGRAFHTAGSGATALIVPDGSPLVSVRVVLPGGELAVSEKQAGLPTAWSRLLTGGAGSRDAHGVDDLIDSLGADLRPLAGRHGLGLAVTAPATELRPLLDLIADLLLDPHLDADEWGRVKAELEDDLRTRADRPAEVLDDRVRALRWHGHPWRLPPGGTAASLARLTPAIIRRFHDRHLAGRRVKIVVAGGVEPDDALAALDWLDELPHDDRPLPARPAVAWPGEGVHAVAAGFEQVHVALQGEGVSLHDEDDRALELAAAVLDGQSGRLFMELRERHALAYDVWARSEELSDGGTFGVGLATRPERADEAVARLRGELERLATSPPAPEELHRARQQLVGGAIIGRQRVAARAAAEAAALQFDQSPDVEAWAARLDAITPDALSARLARVLEAGLLTVRTTPRKR